ncbi:MAG: transketolase [Peptococcaceae bacterium]|nr:transketolase [Peptococcaceae bacterium]
MAGKETLKDLEKVARNLRRDVIEMLTAAQSGHPGGSLSAADILVALYFHEMRLDPLNPDWPDRDRFVLSKGHAAPALYAALAHRGFFSVDDLTTLRRLGSNLQGHPDMIRLSGVDMTTGSLGQGLSVAVGMALAGKTDGKTFRVYTLLGDGEINEGMVWEAAMAAAHYKLDNLVAVVDSNGLQIDGPTATVMNSAPLSDKWSAFGWHVELADGHDFASLTQALSGLRQQRGRPGVVIARTVKGKGVSFMENKAEWHGVAPNRELADKALKELADPKGDLSYD